MVKEDIKILKYKKTQGDKNMHQQKQKKKKIKKKIIYLFFYYFIFFSTHFTCSFYKNFHILFVAHCAYSKIEKFTWGLPKILSIAIRDFFFKTCWCSILVDYLAIMSVYLILTQIPKKTLKYIMFSLTIQFLIKNCIFIFSLFFFVF